MTNFLSRTKMKMSFLLVTIIVFVYSAGAQVTINGPSCIVPGMPYQYLLNGNWNSSSWMRICIVGGRLNSAETCTPDNSVISSVFVTWTDTAYHKLEVVSSSGNVNLLPIATTELKGGLIHDSDKVQVYDSAISIYTFRCAQATGGSCEPIYQYQWQKSENGLSWTNIGGAGGKDLAFPGSVKVNTYFRRVTNEINSKTMVYSEWALLTVVF